METHSTASFNLDKEHNKVTVEKTFLAPLDQVWNAWTQREILDQWWAPKPWKAVTKTMDFREGGFWLYSMEGPEGEKTWGKATFTRINKPKGFDVLDAFSDENGIEDASLPQLHWKISFNTVDNKTVVTIEITLNTAADFDKIIEMGFKEGFLAGLGNLEEYLRK